jgi:hypothetical protein
MTPRYSVIPGGGENERVAPMKVVKVPLKKVTSNFKEAFRRCPTICFLDQFSVVARHKTKEDHFLTH